MRGFAFLALAATLAATAACQTPSAPACPRVEAVEVMRLASKATRPVNYRDHPIQVSRTPIVTLADVTRVRWNEQDWAVLLDFTPEAGERLERTTSRLNFPLALVIDDEVVMAAVIQGGYGIGKDGLQVSLDRRKPAKELTDLMSRCATGSAHR